jgi:catechol 2,3-dioxygenase-like lactoylglutathione lyase family enzyme
MTVERMDNVGIVVEDLDGAIAFFAELGLELEGRMVVEGSWVDGVLGLTDARSEIAMLRTPDGNSRLELAMYHHPAAGRTEPAVLAPNTLGLHRVMFAVDDIDDTVARLEALGGELVGRIEQFENVYRLCYFRGPGGIIVGIAQQIG